jgi:hypothetical protein
MLCLLAGTLTTNTNTLVPMPSSIQLTLQGIQLSISSGMRHKEMWINTDFPAVANDLAECSRNQEA